MNIDPRLINECIDGNRRSQNELYRLSYHYLMSICIRYTNNSERAKENLNLGFYRVLKYLKSYKQSEPFKPWIRKVMINTLIKEYKKEKAQNLNLVYVEDYYDSERYSEMNTIMEKVNSEEIYRFITLLPSASRQVFNLYFIDGYKHREIAEMMDFSEGTSKWHLNSAREKLKEMILNAITEKQDSDQTKTFSAHE